jgi:hypothetical protein
MMFGQVPIEQMLGLPVVELAVGVCLRESLSMMSSKLRVPFYVVPRRHGGWRPRMRLHGNLITHGDCPTGAKWMR